MPLWLIIYLSTVVVGTRLIFPLFAADAYDTEGRWFSFLMAAYLGLMGGVLWVIPYLLIFRPVRNVMKKKNTDVSSKFFRLWGVK
jgi:hypothetical protein